MSTPKEYQFGSLSTDKLRAVRPGDLLNRGKTKRLMRSSVLLPSQYHAYSCCVEFMKGWFLDKFQPNYFNSVYVHDSHAMDQFRMFSDINQQLKRTNPLLSISPQIDFAHNRDWIDSRPEIPMLMRRAKMEGTFFNDVRDNRGLHLQILFKTISMQFTYRMRLDTFAQAMDMLEWIKLKHRAGWSENATLDLDIIVPNGIITQIAFDNAMDLDDMGHPIDNIEMLNYLNTHSLIPFIYKLRCATGNSEYFIKVPNCSAHITSELPTVNDGDRQDTLVTNYTVDFNVNVVMTAPYCYTYFSQSEHKYINSKPVDPNYDAAIVLMRGIMTQIPQEDENHWALLTTTEYEVDKEELNKPMDIDFKELFAGSGIGRIIEYTQRIAVSPAVFLNFVIYNGGSPMKWEMDWGKMICHVEGGPKVTRSLIGIYTNQKYINDTLIYLKELQTDASNSRVF